jgi:hypothetical protein
VVRTFAGTGNRETGSFRVGPHRRWGLEWTYHCPAVTPAGRLIIAEGDAPRSGVGVSAAGATGHGSAWTYSDDRRHYLLVVTGCAWTVRVIAAP